MRMGLHALCAALAFAMPYYAASGAQPERKPDGAGVDIRATETVLPLGLVEAKTAMGFPPQMAKLPLVTGRDFNFTIIDNGFHGLGAWLEEHPAWKDKVRHVSLRKDGAKAAEKHGFDVFRVATAVMPKAKFLLIEGGGFESRIKTMRSNGSFFATMSLGNVRYIGGSDVSMYFELFRMARKYQVTFLVSAGNYRQKSHVFDYSDMDGNGVLEFAPAAEGAIRKAEFNRIDVAEGATIRISLGWGEYGDVRSSFELQLVDRDRKVLAAATTDGREPFVLMSYRPTASGALWLRVIDKTPGGAAQTRPRLGVIVMGAGTRNGIFNGLESLGAYAQQDSPFVVPVGSFGKNGDGELVPSKFSSIGHTNTGEIAPFVLGPGQLELDGEILSGTSFATPFLAAMYSIFADYNIRNVIAETSRHNRWASGLSPEEKGRHGIPDASLVLNNRCIASNRVEDIRHRVEDGKLVIEFLFTRDCMEGLDYYLHAFVSRYVMRNGMLDIVPVRAAKGKGDLRGWVQKHSTAKLIDKEPIRIEIPLDLIPRDRLGEKIDLTFRLSTYAQWDPARIPGAPTYSLTLPTP